MCMPHRYDVADESCVNTEVKTFNRQVQKLMKTFKHVVTIKTDINREHFTRHSLHMNFLGKELISTLISIAIKEIILQKKENDTN